MIRSTEWQEATAAVANVATRGDPNSDTNGGAASGVILTRKKAYVITVSADSGHVLEGTGVIDLWRWSDKLGRWTHNPDLQFPITAAGVTWVNRRDRCSAEIPIEMNMGRMLAAPNGVGIDGGTNVTVTIEAVEDA